MNGSATERFPDPGDWAIALDLGEDNRATEQDALYVREALASVGVRSLFYPWAPESDVLTPLGALRPVKVLVSTADVALARDLVADVLRDREERTDIRIPTADPWVLGLNYRVVFGHLRQRALTRGGAWRAAYEVFRAAILATLTLALLSVAWQIVGFIASLRP